MPDDFVSAYLASIMPATAPATSRRRFGSALSQDDLEDALREAGWPEDKIPMMSAFGMAEGARADEGGIPKVKANSYNPGIGIGGEPTVEQSIGPWQINMHPSLGRKYDRQRLATDPVYNAQAALEIYKKQGLDAWRNTWKRGTYKKFLRNQPTAPAPTAPASFVDAYVQANPPQAQAPEVTAPPPSFADAYVQEQKPAAAPTPSPTVPSTQYVKPPNLVPEGLDTIQAQIDSAADPMSPRAAVLTNTPEQNAPFGQRQDFQMFKVPQGFLWVNTEKANRLNLKTPEEIGMVLSQPDGMTKLIGKVENVGDDTSKGAAVITKDAQGRELATSIVTNTADAAAQRIIDREQFPQAASQEITTAQDAARQRQVQTGKRTGEPFTDTLKDLKDATDAKRKEAKQAQLQQQYQDWLKKWNVPDSPEMVAAFNEELKGLSEQQYQKEIDAARAKEVSAQIGAPPQAGQPTQQQQRAAGPRVVDTISATWSRQGKGNAREELLQDIANQIAAKYGVDTQTALDAMYEEKWWEGGQTTEGEAEIYRKRGDTPTFTLRQDFIDELQKRSAVRGRTAEIREQGLSPDELAKQKELEKHVREPSYVGQQTVAEALTAALNPFDAANREVKAYALGNWLFGDGSAPVSEKFVREEREKLRQAAGSYRGAVDTAEHYRDMGTIETLARMGSQVARSFTKSLLGGTAKTAQFLSKAGDYGTGMDPIRQLGNVLEFSVRTMSGEGAADALKRWQGPQTELDKQHLFRAVGEFEEAVGDDPILKNRLLGLIAEGGGSAASFIAMGALMPSLPLGRAVAGIGSKAAIRQALPRFIKSPAFRKIQGEIGLAGALQAGGPGYEEAKKQGLSERDAMAYGVVQTLLGGVEMFGAGAEAVRAIKNPAIRRKFAEGILEWTKRHGKAGFKEAKQEFWQEIGQTTGGKAALEYLKDKEPDQYQRVINALKRVPEQFASAVANEGPIAATIGGIMGTGGSILGDIAAAPGQAPVETGLERVETGAPPAGGRPPIEPTAAELGPAPEAAAPRPATRETKGPEREATVKPDWKGEYIRETAGLLPEQTPQRIEVADPQAVQQVAVDTRARKVVDVLKTRDDFITIDELAKATRTNPTAVEDAVMKLYGARMVELLPGNRVKLIDKEATIKQADVFERAKTYGQEPAEAPAPTQPAKPAVSKPAAPVVTPEGVPAPVPTEAEAPVAAEPAAPTRADEYAGKTFRHPTSKEKLTFTGEISPTGTLIATNEFGKERRVARTDADKWLAEAEAPAAPVETEGERLARIRAEKGVAPVAPEPQPQPVPEVPKAERPTKTIEEKIEAKHRDLTQFVRSAGGMRPDFESRRAGKLGGLDRLRNKETGTSGLLNKNGISIEDMAIKAWENGYLRDVFPNIEDINPDTFLDELEADFRGIRKHMPPEYYEELDDRHDERMAEMEAKLQQDAERQAAYAQKQEDDLEKQALLLADPEAGEILALFTREGDYGTDALGIATDENSRRLQKLLDKYGIDDLANRNARAVIAAHLAGEVSAPEAGAVERPVTEEPRAVPEREQAVKPAEEEVPDWVTEGLEPEARPEAPPVTTQPETRPTRLPTEPISPLTKVRVQYARERGMPESDIAQRYGLTPEDVAAIEELPAVGTGGQMSYRLRQAFIPSKTATDFERAAKIDKINDLAAELDMPDARVSRDEAQADIANKFERVKNAIAESFGHKRGSEMTRDNWLDFLDTRGSRLSHDTIIAILDSFEAQTEHAQKVGEFLQDGGLVAAMNELDEKIGLENIKDFNDIPKTIRDKIVTIASTYGIKRHAAGTTFRQAIPRYLEARTSEGRERGPREEGPPEGPPTPPGEGPGKPEKLAPPAKEEAKPEAPAEAPKPAPEKAAPAEGVEGLKAEFESFGFNKPHRQFPEHYMEMVGGWEKPKKGEEWKLDQARDYVQRQVKRREKDIKETKDDIATMEARPRGLFEAAEAEPEEKWSVPIEEGFGRRTYSRDPKEIVKDLQREVDLFNKMLAADASRRDVLVPKRLPEDLKGEVPTPEEVQLDYLARHRPEDQYDNTFQEAEWKRDIYKAVLDADGEWVDTRPLEEKFAGKFTGGGFSNAIFQLQGEEGRFPIEHYRDFMRFTGGKIKPADKEPERAEYEAESAEFQKKLDESIRKEYPKGTRMRFDSGDEGIVDHNEGRYLFVSRIDPTTGKLGKPRKVDVENIVKVIEPKEKEREEPKTAPEAKAEAPPEAAPVLKELRVGDVFTFKKREWTATKIENGLLFMTAKNGDGTAMDAKDLAKEGYAFSEAEAEPEPEYKTAEEYHQREAGTVATRFADQINEYLIDTEIEWPEGAENAKFERQDVPIDKLTEAMVRPLDSLEQVRVEEMAGQTRSKGPIILDSDYSVIDGMHRIADKIKSGDRVLDAFVRIKPPRPPKKLAPTEKPEPEPAPEVEISGLETFEQFAEKVRKGDATAAEVKAAYKSLLENEQGIKLQLSRKTVAELKKEYASPYATRKAEFVDSAYDALRDFFALGKPIMWSPFAGGSSYKNAVDKAVEALTDEHIQQYAKQVETRKAERKERLEGLRKALEDPETLQEFETYIQHRSINDLSPQQRARMDKLFAEKTLAARKAKKEKEPTVEAVDIGDTELKITKGYHTKHQKDIWIVSMGERLPTEQYKELEAKARMLGGRYQKGWKPTNTPAGFQFFSQESAEKFAGLKEGAADRSDELEARKARRQMSTLERLRDSASTLRTAGEESLKQERLANTPRRAAQAANAERKARTDIAMADTMDRVAEAIEKGEVKYLTEISARTQFETLESLLKRGVSETERQEIEASKDKFHQPDFKREPTEADIANVKYPYPATFEGDKTSLQRVGQTVEGGKILARRLVRNVTFGKPIGRMNIDTLIDLVQRMKYARSTEGKAIYYRFGEAVANVKRLDSIGLTNANILREALREYLPLRKAAEEENKVKKLERELVGTNYGRESDYFPTPPDLARKVAEIADIQPGMSVLEPSAGKGNLIDAIAEHQPEADVEAVEPLEKLRQITEAKGYNLVGSDFMDFKPEKQYDRIVMNPPFKFETEHVQKAYDLLKPGGRLVAITSPSWTFAKSKKAEDFRKFVEEAGGYAEDLPEGSFARGEVATGVNTKLLVMDKPIDEGLVSAARTAPMLAPNGKPSKLSPRLYDLVRTPEFKAWFGDWENDPARSSKILDENGEPKVMYHGTHRDFAVFDRSAGWAKKAGIASVDQIGIWVTDTPEAAEMYGPIVMPLFVNSRQPLALHDDPKKYITEFDIEAEKDVKKQTSRDAYDKLRDWFERRFKKDVEQLRIKSKDRGWDSVRLKDTVIDGEKVQDAYIVFEPEQLKSAIGNIGAFKPTEPSILAARVTPIKAKPETVSKKEAEGQGFDTAEIKEIPIKKFATEGSVIYFDETPGTVSVLNVETEPAMRRQGKAARLIRELQRYATENDKDIDWGAYTEMGEQYLRPMIEALPARTSPGLFGQTDLFGETTPNEEQGMLFLQTAADKMQQEQAKEGALEQLIPKKTADFLRSLQDSPDKEVKKAATAVIDAAKFADAKRAGQMIEYAADALDIFARARHTKTPVADMLNQQWIGGPVKIADFARVFALSMERGDIAPVLTQAITQGTAGEGGFETSRKPAPQTESFKKWFGNSKVVDENGDPLIVFRGEPEDFGEFRDFSFFAESPKHAADYGRFVMPVYLKAEKLFDYEDPKSIEKMRPWVKENIERFNMDQDPEDSDYDEFWNNNTEESIMNSLHDGVAFQYIEEVDGFTEELQRLGFDGFTTEEQGKNYAIFDAKNVRSAISDPSILAARITAEETARTTEADFDPNENQRLQENVAKIRRRVPFSDRFGRAKIEYDPRTQAIITDDMGLVVMQDLMHSSKTLAGPPVQEAVVTGATFNPFGTDKLMQYLEYLEREARVRQGEPGVPKPEDIRQIRETIEKGIDQKYNDLIIVHKNPAMPKTYKGTMQEEQGHRADQRTEYDFGGAPGLRTHDTTLFEGKRSYENASFYLEKVKDYPKHQIHIEVIGKIGRDDAAEELGLSEEQVKELRLIRDQQLFDRGMSQEMYYERYGSISEANAQRAKQYGQTTAIPTGKHKPETGGDIGPMPRGGPELRTGRYGPREGYPGREQPGPERPELRREPVREPTAKETKGELTPEERRFLEVKTKNQPGLFDDLQGEVLAARTGPAGKKPWSLMDFLIDMANAPKAIKSSMDLSAAGRQGLILALTNPRFAARAFKRQLQAAMPGKGADFYQNFKDNYLDLHPYIELAEESGLYLGSLASDQSLSQREDAFMSRLFGEDPVFTGKGETIRKGLTTGVRLSERGYLTFLDSIRMDTFQRMANEVHEYNQRKGRPDDPEQYKAIAQFINYASGRGNLGKFSEAVPYLNPILWSPRYWASRLQIMNPAFYAKMPPGARKLAIRKLMRFAGTVGGAMVLLKLAGFDIEADDPNDPDTLKVGFGKYKYDITGGLIQHLRYVARMAMATQDKAPGKRMVDLTERYLRSKLSPTAGAAANVITGETYIREPTSLKEELLGREGPLSRVTGGPDPLFGGGLISPLSLSNFTEAANAEGVAGLAKMAPEFFGISTTRVKEVEEIRQDLEKERAKLETAETPEERKEIARRIKLWQQRIKEARRYAAQDIREKAAEAAEP